MSMKAEIARELRQRAALPQGVHIRWSSWKDRAPSEKQVNFLAFLLWKSEQPRTDEDLRRIFDTLPDERLTCGMASEMIDNLT